MFTLFLRAIFLYGVMILTMRLLGKRQLGEYQPYELALTILLADIISGPIGSVSTPLLYGLLPVAAVIVLHGILSLICLKSDRARAIISGKPMLVINRGKIDRRALNRLCLSLSDLLEGLRSAGYLDISEVGTAIVEANGTISAFPSAENRPPKLSELSLPTSYEGLPLNLIMDGQIQPHNLHASGFDRKWLLSQLSQRGLAIEPIYLAMLDTQGRMLLQLKDGAMLRFQAISPAEVIW